MSATGTPLFRCWITSAWAHTVQAEGGVLKVEVPAGKVVLVQGHPG